MILTSGNEDLQLEEGQLFESDLKISMETIRRYYDMRTFAAQSGDVCVNGTADSRDPATPTQGTAPIVTIWKRGVVPYEFDSPRVTASLARSIRDAMDLWENSTCLRFTRRRNEKVEEADYLFFSSNSSEGCYSDSVGRKGGQQVINVVEDECGSVGGIAHLIGHAVGFWHEHSRHDRDKYVLVVEKNVQEGEMINFLKREEKEEEHNFIYDYASLMHLPVTIHSECEEAKPEACPTLVVIHPSIYKIQGSPTIGQRESLSAQDVYKVRAKYPDDLCTDQYQHGALLIHVQDGRNLPVGGSYVRVVAKDKEGYVRKAQTALKPRNQQNPTWNEWLNLGIGDYQYFRISLWGTSGNQISISETVMIGSAIRDSTVKYCTSIDCNSYVRFLFRLGADVCSPNPCLNGGFCAYTALNYTCSCPFNYLGQNCETRCPCQNNGTCIGQTTNCSCRAGYVGSNCETKCPCQNGGRCVGQTTKCNCPADYTGPRCETRCPCQNGGTCIGQTTTCNCPPPYVGSTCESCPCLNGGTCVGRTTTCNCPLPYIGARCETRCPCQNGGTCIGQTTRCNCPHPFYSVEPTCDRCPCLNGGTCIGQTTRCNCPDGYIGRRCETRCPCENGGRCNGDTTTCNCPDGYIGRRCETRCPCENHGTCIGQTTRCNCPPPYVGETCETRCPCLNGGTCVGQTTECNCRSPYVGDRCETRCPCQNGGTCIRQTTQCDCPTCWKGPRCNIKNYVLEVYVRSGTRLPDEDPAFNDSDPYAKIIAYDSDGRSNTEKTDTIQGDESPTWNEWLRFGRDTWTRFKIRVYDDDIRYDDAMSNWEEVTIRSGCSNYLTHRCYSGYITYYYCFQC